MRDELRFLAKAKGRFFARQSLMGETTPLAHGGNPQDRAALPLRLCMR
jgi:hypothetical protein